MPIKPKPRLIQCRQCSWQTTYAPPSDVLVIPPPAQCPKCGSTELDSKPAGMVDGLIATLSSLRKP